MGYAPSSLLQTKTLTTSFVAAHLEGHMACKRCSSVAQQEFPADLTVSFPDIKRLTVAPVYVCQHILVCLTCGVAEQVIPAPELERLRKGMAASRSQGA